MGFENGKYINNEFSRLTNLFSFRELKALAKMAVDEGPDQRLFETSHFTRFETDHGDKFKPCNCKDSSCQEKSFAGKDLPRDSILSSPVTMEDIRRARRCVKASTDEDEQMKLKEYLKEDYVNQIFDQEEIIVGNSSKMLRCINVLCCSRAGQCVVFVIAAMIIIVAIISHFQNAVEKRKMYFKDRF